MLVVFLKMGVMGVAIATVSCQGISACMVTWILIKGNSLFRLKIREIRFYMASLQSVLRIGIPAALEATMYTIANLIIQIFVNGLGTDTVAAWGTFAKIDAIYWMVVNSFGIAITTFVGQNYGAGKIQRMRKKCQSMSAYVLWSCNSGKCSTVWLLQNRYIDCLQRTAMLSALAQT